MIHNLEGKKKGGGEEEGKVYMNHTEEYSFSFHILH